MVDIGGCWLTAEDRHLLRQPEVGGLILFARNIDSPQQVRELCMAVRAIRPDVLLAVDQEGGRVQRLRQGFVSLPAMSQLQGCADAAGLSEYCGWLMATEVLACGLDFSFAPVLDLDVRRSAVIGSRAFSADPQQVVSLAGAFIRGMHTAGMAATGKHFPGHGWAEADSHVAIPVDERDLDSIRATDMLPFRQLAAELDGVMPAHIIYPALDNVPAGFSQRWLQGILRDELAFSGVIFSDDLSMAGAHTVGGMPERVETALRAGCDMALVCNDRAAAETALLAAQRLAIRPSERLARMHRRRMPSVEYRQSPRWSRAVAALRGAGLID